MTGVGIDPVRRKEGKTGVGFNMPKVETTSGMDEDVADILEIRGGVSEHHKIHQL